MYYYYSFEHSCINTIYSRQRLPHQYHIRLFISQQTSSTILIAKSIASILNPPPLNHSNIHPNVVKLLIDFASVVVLIRFDGEKSDRHACHLMFLTI